VGGVWRRRLAGRERRVELAAWGWRREERIVKKRKGQQ
jgi:hypothetical protein